MSDVIVPGNEDGKDGVARFFNLAIKAYYNDKQNISNATVKQLKDCIVSKDIKVYVTDIREEKDSKGEYDLLAVNKDNKVKCFTINCDNNLQIKDVAKVDKSNLSDASKDYFTQITNRELDEPGPSTPKL